MDDNELVKALRAYGRLEASKREEGLILELLKRFAKVKEERDAAVELALLNGRALESLFPGRGK